ncbi:WYL domain-containing protein [Pseudoalteromonas sp. APC 3356]|uniref:WYL domain-containing protein n=1 Tax=Pseudoalteromonas sp. APC 3356 TaxID=3035185 RepID=UPI0025B5564C|nr:WYL domain-containing protein [Pseudoalteromonas sp. APC 3356]MDN3436373.1 WYL domain-containing protein [Pseudoalteromonas sp. APC 3356]
MELENVNYAQKQRLAFIDFKLMFTSSVTRNEIIQRFECGTAAASRDLALYKELAPKNLSYNTTEKQYIIESNFKPLFNHDPRKTLVKLANEISDGFDAISDTKFPVEAPSSLNVPDLMIVARISQAIFQNKAVNIIYTSLSSGSGARDIVPHSIVDNGLRWHVRAYCRKSKEFRDFVLTRITKATVMAGLSKEHESKEHDKEWNTFISLELVPHPKNIKHPTAIALDYGMVDGSMTVKARAALTGYLLRRWNVDCSSNAELKGSEYQLYLNNKSLIDGALNFTLAPGYKL